MMTASELLINLNGTIYPNKELVFNIQNRAFRYGDGLFESIRMIDGKLPLLPLHAERLFQAMQALKFNFHKSFNLEFIESEILALARKNKIVKDARIRFSVFREDGGLYTPLSANFKYLIEITPLETEGYQWNKKGLIIDVYTETKKDFGNLSSFKTNNSLPYVLSGVHAKELQVDECLLLNSQNNLVESTSSNLFLVKDQQIFTPALTEGCINGVMRKHILQLAQKMGIKIHETTIPENALNIADEIFLSNSSKGIQWVVGFRGKRFYSKFSRMIYDELIKS